MREAVESTRFMQFPTKKLVINSLLVIWGAGSVIYFIEAPSNFSVGAKALVLFYGILGIVGYLYNLIRRIMRKNLK